MFSRYYLNEALEDVRFDFQLRDDIVIGAPFRYKHKNDSIDNNY